MDPFPPVSVAEALHEIADRLGNRGRAVRLANRVESRSGYYAELDTRYVYFSFTL